MCVLSLDDGLHLLQVRHKARRRVAGQGSVMLQDVFCTVLDNERYAYRSWRAAQLP